MIPEVFIGGNSVIHSVNPRLKVVFALLYSVVIALSSNVLILSASLITSAVMVMVARLQAREVLKRLTVLMGFVLLIWLLVPLTYPGSALFNLGPLGFSGPGVRLAAQISLKSTSILLSLMALLATMSIATLGHVLRDLGVPDKLVYLLLITYRYVFVIEQEYQRLLRAMRIRGFKPGTNLHSYRSYAYLAGMLIVHAWSRADRVSKAMKCRGFTGQFHTLWQVQPDPRNRSFALIMSLIILFLATVEIWTRITFS